MYSSIFQSNLVRPQRRNAALSPVDGGKCASGFPQAPGSIMASCKPLLNTCPLRVPGERPGGSSMSAHAYNMEPGGSFIGADNSARRETRIDRHVLNFKHLQANITYYVSNTIEG